MASYSFIDADTLIQETDTTSHVIPVPAGTANGDLLLFFLLLDGATTITSPGAFTVVDDDYSGGGGEFETGWRIASSEPADYTWTSDVVSESVGAILAYRGGNTTSPFNDQAIQDVAPPITFPSITTTADGCLLVLVAAADNPNAGGAGGYSTPTDYTERLDIQNVSQRNTLAVFDRLQASAGTESGVTTTYSGTSESPSPITLAWALEPLVADTGLAWIRA